MSTVLVGALLLDTQAFAQSQRSADVAAEDLFQTAKQRFAEKKYAEACPLFAESYRLDGGGGTLQNLAVCYEELGKTATAYARFQELRTMSKAADPPRPDRVKLADDHIEKLTPRLARIRIVAKDMHADLVVKIDDVVYGQVSWAAGVLVDPGEHSVRFEAAGKLPVELKIKVPPVGGLSDLVAPALADAPKPGSFIAPVPPEGNEHPLRSTGLVVIGAGVAALGAGAVFGLLTIRANQAGRDRCTRASNVGAPASDFDSSGHCFAGSDTLRAANDDKDRARTFGTVATVLIPVGLVGLGLGTYFVLRTKPARADETARPVARLRPTLGGFVVEGEL